MSNRDLDWLAHQQPEQITPDPAARDRALMSLLQHTTSRPSGRGLRFASVLRTKTFGLGTSAAATAIVAALVLSAGGNTVAPTNAGHTGSIAQVKSAVAHHHATGSALVHLADYVSASAAPTGDATLVARTTGGNGSSVTVYDLYADSGEYFFSRDESGLAGQVSANDNLADGLFAREIAAAKLGATGNVQTAAQDLADAPDPSEVVSPTQTTPNSAALAMKLKLLHMPANYQPGSRYDNYVWENAQDALIAGSGDPQVRAGILQILATLNGVTVTHSSLNGQPTLVLAAGTPEMGSGYTEQLTINADTGVPIQFLGGPTGTTPAITVDYSVSRVSLSNLPSGSAGSN